MENLAWIVTDDQNGELIGRLYPIAHPPSYVVVTRVCILPQYLGEIQNEWKERYENYR